MNNQQNKFSPVIVFVVDDNSDHRDIMEVYLERAEARTQFFGNGQDVVDLLEEKQGLRADTIFMDIRMPGLSGEQTVEILRNRGCRIPIIGTSAFVTKEEQESLLRVGFTEILLKPLSFEKIKELLEKYRLRS